MHEVVAQRTFNVRGRLARDRVLGAATSLFAERGYAGTSFADVAERSGLKKSAILYHFTEKEELWRLAVDKLWADVDAFYRERWPTEKLGKKALLLKTFEIFIDASVAFPAYVRIPFIEGATPSWRSEWLVDKHFASHVKSTDRVIRSAQRLGLIPPADPAHILAMISSGINVFVAQRAMWNRTFERDLGDVAALRAYLELVISLTIRSESVDSSMLS